MALPRLETELGEKLIDRSAEDLVLTDAGRTVLDYARRFENLQLEMENSLAEVREFQRRCVPLNMPVEMPTIETIRKLVQNNQGVAFLPRMCVEQEIEQGLLREVKVKELHVERKVRLIYPTRRVLSHAARAFLEVVRGK